MKTFKQLLFIQAIILTTAGSFAQTIDNITDFTPYKSYNYIFSKTVLIPQTGTATNYREVFQYYDGLGRLIQTVDFKASPKKNDVIQPVEYDNFGREAIKYLPYTDTINSSTKKALYRSQWKTEQSAFYTTRYDATDGTKAYSMTVFENSPLNRVMKQGAPGNTWQPVASTTSRQSNEHVISYQYASNTATDLVYYWTISSTYPSVTFSRKTYAAGTLYKNIVTDENGNPMTEFKDLQGKVVLKTDALRGRTYYVYDDFELLRCVIPPLASQTLAASSKTSFSSGEADFQELCYYYEYDHRQRMIKKKLPGTVGVYEMTYDNLDRLIETKDPNGKIISTIYDIFSRPVETKDKSTGIFLTKTHYDSYTKNGIDYAALFQYTNVYGYSRETEVKGKVTATVTRVLDKLSGMRDSLRSVTYYDKYGRVIQTISENHKGGIDRISLKYKYKNSDLVEQKTHQHSISISGTTISQTIVETYTYDHAGRLLTTTHKINSNDAVILSQQSYNETGQLTEKYSGGLERLVYKYNIRGWLTHINNPTNYNNGKLFNLWLDYTNSYSNNRYNGNIIHMVWSRGDAINKHYYFSYDELNRLKGASYREYSQTEEVPGTTNKYTESYSYDANGNIKGVTRCGLVNDGTIHVGYHDLLTYKYFNNDRSNRLWAVGDNAADVAGRGDFTESSDGYATQEYYYDNNGNMKKDYNKNLTVTYNLLNLPRTYYINNDNYSFGYLGDGIKIWSNTRMGTAKSTNEYIGPFVYRDGDLDYIITNEGRAVFSDGGLNYYEFHLKDHLGNVRVVFRKDGSALKVLQSSDYYPFGLRMAEKYDDPSLYSRNRYLYNGKELVPDVNLNWYDYGARMYDPQLGRWHVVDPMTEKFFGWSPYRYGLNNPLLFVDPNGMLEDDYGVDNDGNIIKLRDTEDNYDVLYAVEKDKDGKLVEKDLNKDGKITEEDGQKVNDQTILPELTESREDYNGNYASSGNLQDIGNIFLFSAANSNVEWSFDAFKNNNSTTYVVATSHQYDKVTSVTSMSKFNELNLTMSLHSHPSPDGTKGASYAGGTGDYYNVIQFYNRFIAAGKKPDEFPKHGIYHKQTKTIYWYTPWNKSIKGHTFK